MKILFSAVILICCNFIALADTDDSVRIQTLIVYQDAVGRGYTTAGATTHFQDMKAANVSSMPVDNEKKLRFASVLNRASGKKHVQTKVGVGLIFMEMRLTGNGNMPHKLIMPGYHGDPPGGGKEKSRVIITDLSSMRNYIVTEPQDLKWLAIFVKQVGGNG